MDDVQREYRQVVTRCPMCNHSVRQHRNGIAHQELNTMGCTTCSLCEVTRMSLAVEHPGRHFASESSNTVEEA